MSEETQVSGMQAARYRDETAGTHEKDLLTRAGEFGVQIEDAAAKHGYVAIAVVAGLAFAIGALWRSGTRPKLSRLDSLRARLPEIPSADRLRSYWH